jgi:hypothetical protein
MENKVVVHMRDGTIHKGVTQEFSPDEELFHLTNQPDGQSSPSTTAKRFGASSARAPTRTAPVFSSIPRIRRTTTSGFSSFAPR